MFTEIIEHMDKRIRELAAAVARGFQANNAQLDTLVRRQAASVLEIARISREQDSQRRLLEKILIAVILPPAVKALMAVEVEGVLHEGEHIEMKIPQNTTKIASVSYKNAAEGPGRVDGVPVWSAAPDGVVTLEPAADGLTCKFTTLPLPDGVPFATAVITSDADGDLGEGVVDIIATGAVTVFDPAGNAVVAEMTFSDPA